MLKPDYEIEGVSLYLGDCLEILPKLPEGGVSAVLADPPYGIDYQSAWRTDKSQWKPKIANDKRPFIWWLHSAYRVTVDPGCLICFCRWDVQECFRSAVEASGYTVSSQVIWDRYSHGMGDLSGSFAPQHDVLWFGVKGKFKFHEARPHSVITIKRLSAEALMHPNQKPYALMECLVRPLCPKGQTVLDPFMGSGTTGVACIKTGRKFIGIEKEEKYFDIAVKRIEAASREVPLPMEANG